MGSAHEFILINFDDIPAKIHYQLVNSPLVIEKCIITDKFIVRNYRELSPKYARFSTYWDTIGNTKTGLCYYGNTIFVSDMLPAFFEAFNSIAECDEKERLMNLCQTAIDKALCIIHFGI